MALNITINDQSITIPLTEEGYLVNVSDWNKQIAERVACDEAIDLNEQHWQMIYCLREFYLEHQLIPPLRAFINVLRKQYNDATVSSALLHKLFPGGPLKQAARIAGLPKPKKCM